jgi:hypothetical protein
METMKTVCRNAWCKATFLYTEDDCKEVDGVKVGPNICTKCKSFDAEMSGGVTWEDKVYEGDRFDSIPHEFKYKIRNFY